MSGRILLLLCYKYLAQQEWIETDADEIKLHLTWFLEPIVLTLTWSLIPIERPVIALDPHELSQFIEPFVSI